jgi:hypothetical protein
MADEGGRHLDHDTDPKRARGATLVLDLPACLRKHASGFAKLLDSRNKWEHQPQITVLRGPHERA